MSGSSWALVAVLTFGLVAFLFFMNWYVNRQSEWLRAQQDPCDYVVFEADPSHLPLLEADLADHRWDLADSEEAQSGAMLYRFEKRDAHAALLSEVLDFRRSMPRTASRKHDPHVPIKIKAQGRRDERHG